MWENVVKLFQEYMGMGLIVTWFLICLIYLWISEKRKNIRILFVYTPVILLLLYFNPLSAQLIYGVAGVGIYYRILWLLPITPVIAYSCSSIYGKLTENRGKVAALVFALCAAAAVVFSGSFIYANPYFAKAENRFHVPDSVVHICDEIIIPGREVMAAFPMELVQYVRQYTSLVRMPYGREMLEEYWYFYNEMYELMETEVIDLAALNQAAVEAYCHYVILRDEQKVVGSFADYGWELYCRTDGYSVYRVTECPLELN